MATTQGTADLLALKRRIEAMTLGDQLRLVAGLLDMGGKDDIAETLASNVVDALRAKRMLGRARETGKIHTCPLCGPECAC